MKQPAILAWLVLAFSACAPASAQPAQPIGIFQAAGDVGAVKHKGSAAFDSGSGRYRITG